MEHYSDRKYEDDNLIILKTAFSDKNKRADVFFAKELNLSRSNIQKLMSNGFITIGDKIIKQNYRIKGNEEFLIEYEEQQKVEIMPENIPLDIIYEDENMIVLNKKRGMVVHPAPGHFSGTLVNALLYYCEHLSNINGDIRPGIVHRLDKDTSGIMVVAKNDDSHVDLALQIKNKIAKRDYLAIVHGNVKNDSGEIKTLIARDQKNRKNMAVVTDNGRESITRYKVIERFGEYTLVTCSLLTGRTHQIRVHMKYLGFPLVGDPKYGTRKNKFIIKGQALHSYQLKLNTLTGEEKVFRAELPSDMKNILSKLRQK